MKIFRSHRSKERLFERLALGLVLAVVAFGLGACRESEQGRVLMYDKGSYLGKKDPGLSEKDLVELRDRTALQATAIGVGAPSYGSAPTPPR